MPMIVTCVVFAVLGLCVGSFLNLCIDRLPRDESIIRPPSRCDNCGRRLGVIDLVPVLSYLWLRGRCRYCDAHVPVRSPLVELASGIIFGLLCWHYGLHLELLFVLTYTSIFIVIFGIDLEHELILDKVVFPSLVLALIFMPFRHDLSVKDALIGGAVGFAIVLVVYVIFASRGGFGEGDVKLAPLLGLATGFPLILAALVLSVVMGGVIALFLLATGLRGRKEAIPFGPFLVTGTLIIILWGEPLWDWYLNWPALLFDKA